MRKQIELLEHHADFAADELDILEILGCPSSKYLRHERP
jgi:hypothetical protein